MMSKDQIPDQTMLDEDITVSNSESGHCDAAKLDEKWQGFWVHLSQLNKQTLE